MAEELDIQAALDRLTPYDLNPIERVLAAHTGTVQYLLSLWFNDTVEVVVEPQVEDTLGILLTRDAVLRLRKSQVVVCVAKSTIDMVKCRSSVLDAVREGKLGLGQIAVLQQIHTERTLKALTVTPDAIERTYIMEGVRLYYEITEIFPRERYRE